MKKGLKQKAAQKLGTNQALNNKALRIKKSWDEVERLLQAAGTPKRKK